MRRDGEGIVRLHVWPHQLPQGGAALMAGGDVEKDQIRRQPAGRRTAARATGIPAIAQPNEIDPLTTRPSANRGRE